MKSEKILSNAANALSGVDVGGRKGDPALAELDRGILRVALMISGLDGVILPAEYEAFGAIAKRCRGATARSVKSLYDAAIGNANWLVGMACSGVYSEADRLRAFVRMAGEALPKGFGCGSLADLRRAFALWIAMGFSDGAFSGFERKAVQALMRRFALMRAVKARRFSALLEPDFVSKVEKILEDMAVPSRKDRAEAALNALVSTVAVKEKGGERIFRPSARISLACPPAGPTVTGWK